MFETVFDGATAEVVEFNALRGFIAAAAFVSAAVTIFVYFYSRNFETTVGEDTYRVRVVKTLRRLVGINILALGLLAFCYGVRFFYADPLPRLQPPFVFYTDATTYYVGLLHIVFPAFILFHIVREAKREKEARKA